MSLIRELVNLMETGGSFFPHSPASALHALRWLFDPLPPEQRSLFDDQIDRNIRDLLPVLGPVCGAFVILFGAWDFWIDQQDIATTLRIRVLLVLVGSLAYRQGRLTWSASWRCGWLYATHVGAIAACAAVIPQGLELALPVLTGAMIMLALLEPRPRRFVLVALPAAALVIILAALSLPRTLFLNTVLLYMLSVPLALCVALAKLHLRRQVFLAEQALLRTVRHDSLSGALSRGYLIELATHDIALARRHGRPLAVAMIDIDWFKRVNDTYGHASGDAALCALVDVCKNNLRAGDYIGRFGGEEFVCVMPDSNQEDAMACAERIRNKVSGLCLATEAGPLRFTVSIGVALLDQHYPNWDLLLREADTALYAAKAAGRNRTLFTQGGSHPPSATFAVQTG
jgi:diguanylate cyclase (GGDEF)-like protein